jgi:hypothetical protein
MRNTPFTFASATVDFLRVWDLTKVAPLTDCPGPPPQTPGGLLDSVRFPDGR